MLSQARNAYLTDVSPGAPMHNLLKRYWLPAGRAKDVAEPGCDPVRVQLLSEDYIMLRDRAGNLGLMDEYCPHRRASLMLGRIEEDGIRCIYHGWKFAVDGALLDMPNVRSCPNKDHFRQAAYPVREAGGLIWVYLGPPEHQPPFPDYELFGAAYVRIENPIFEANFVQAMEGLLDSAHLGFLHSDIHSRGIADATGKPVVGALPDQFVSGQPPRIEVQDAPWGFRYAALRDIKGSDGTMTTQARITAFMHPFCAQTASDNTMQMAVPIDNHRTMFYHLFWDNDLDNPCADQMADMLFGPDRTGLTVDTRDHPDAPSRANLYGQDRAAMRRGELFSGLRSVIVEDMAMTNSMGVITDRSKEKLVESDAAVVRVRQMLIANAKRVEDGESPFGIAPASQSRSAEATLQPGERWQDMFAERQAEPAE